jgi:hypothetical protein
MAIAAIGTLVGFPNRTAGGAPGPDSVPTAIGSVADLDAIKTGYGSGHRHTVHRVLADQAPMVAFLARPQDWPLVLVRPAAGPCSRFATPSDGRRLPPAARP